LTVSYRKNWGAVAYVLLICSPNNFAGGARAYEWMHREGRLSPNSWGAIPYIFPFPYISQRGVAL